MGIGKITNKGKEMKYEINIEGLPEGWRPISYRIPIENKDYVFENGQVLLCCWPTYRNYVIVEKIQPRRIVLELTQEEYDLMLKIPIEQRLFSDPSMMSLLEKIRSVKAK